MNVTFVSAGLLALTLVCVFALRSRAVATKLACEILLLALLGACLVYRGTTPLPTTAELAQHVDGAWLRAIAVVWWLITARVVAVIMVIALGRDARSRQARLVSDLLAGAIYITTALIILNSVLDLPVNGLLATSGVIAIVLGLALQNTLADVFSGIAVGLEQPFHVGDRVTIKDYAEGIVVQANWRSICIQTDGEDLATIPNSIVARSQVINHSVPTQQRAATIEIATRSTARSEVLLELIRQATLLSPSVLEQPPPGIALKQIGSRTTTLTVQYFAASTPEMGNARGQLLRQIRRLFRHAGIEEGRPPSPAEILLQTTLFESLVPAQIGRLLPATVSHAFIPGGIVFERGKAGASLYVIQSGVFTVFRHDENGGIQELGRVGPGEYLGEISMMTGKPYSVTVAAVTYGSVLELPKPAIEALLVDDHDFSEALERSVQRGLALLDRDAAARTCDPLDDHGTMLAHIRRFLRHPLRK